MAQAERGEDGQVGIIYWQAPSIMNPYLSGGTKDLEAASLVLEPLARYDENGDMVPWLVDEVPTVENGGVSEDLTSITWKLTEGLVWSDGSPVTSEDVKFSWEYCTAEGGGCAQIEKYGGIESIETPDELTAVVTFRNPKPFPYTAFVGAQSPILQKAQFADCLGPKAPECTEQNFNPIGTGPFVVTDFRPNDVITLEANENYRDPEKPAFASVVFKGGGDATAAGRAVLETGEFDYAWNLQLAPDVLANMESAGKGQIISGFGTLVERIMVNQTNPDPALGPDERSVIRPHPSLSDPAVTQASAMAGTFYTLTGTDPSISENPVRFRLLVDTATADCPTTCLVEERTDPVPAVGGVPTYPGGPARRVVVRDLVVDRSAFDRIIGAGGFISASTGAAPDANAIPIPKDDAEFAMDAAACIGCGACVAACKNASAMLFVSAKVSHLGRLPHRAHLAEWMARPGGSQDGNPVAEAVQFTRQPLDLPARSAVTNYGDHLSNNQGDLHLSLPHRSAHRETNLGTAVRRCRNANQPRRSAWVPCLSR